MTQYDIGDLIEWKDDIGGPPWFVGADADKNSHIGIIYDISYAIPENPETILSYLILWDNTIIFPAGSNEIKLISKGGGDI